MKQILLALAVVITGALVMGAGTVINTPGVPAGAVMAFATSTCPQGWVEADGNTYTDASKPALSAALPAVWKTHWNPETGNAYSAPAAGSFRVPNFHGVFLRGKGAPITGDSVSIGGWQSHKTKLVGITAALSNGAVTISGSTGSDSPGHTHGVRGVNAVTGGASYTFSKANTDAGYNYTSITAGASTVHTHGSGTLAGAVGTGITFSGDGNETRPQNLGVLYCIKY